MYSDEEIEADNTKERTVLFHFKSAESRKFVLICAGGGYNIVCSTSEGFPMAARLNELGYNAFVLNYRCGKGITQPTPMEDLQNALRYIMNNSEALGVDKDGYAVAGFSAGAHLASTIGTDNLGYKILGFPKPAAVILAYPVITMGPLAHAGSREFLFGEENASNEALIDKYSIEKHVSKDYPPVFMWQCREDSLVPCENSHMMEETLFKNGVPFIYETYDSNVHGWSIAIGEDAEGWVDRAANFWQKHIK